MLGFTPSNTDIVGGRIKLVCLLNQLENGFPENPNALQCTQRARLIILYLCGGTLFPDSTNSKVPLLYLNNLLDLSVSSRYSWGSAVLACLYRNLCKATHPDAVEITGPVYLLQLWALERSRTVLYITNPGSEEVNPRGFQNDGGAYQLMMDGMVQIYQSTRQFIGDNPETQNQFQRIQDTVSQVMGLAHEGHRLELPTHLTTQSVNSMGNENVSQVVRRRGRRRNTRGAGRNNEDTADEAGPSGFHNFEAGTSRFQNFEVGGTSNFQDEPNVFVGPESPYIPTFNNPNSPAGSYSEFGVTPQHHMDYTVTPNVVPTYGQQSSFDYFAEDLSMYEQPRYSDVSPIPLNLSLGMMPSQEDENNQRRRRQTRPPPCGTGHRLSRHDH
ncbi:hypothetical protein E3N88_15840 [Mikania micrantha]|uniref:Aminotransferase-like plant mobile domain-containing protein n=1 Tax=Mikania micrantha TaxID=192012 RepID=A0A5N6NWJ5_9ASTR|nr:hypothetical protein E3N88_15840 [Mikania micrantha]